MVINEVLNKGRSLLKRNGIDEREARLLLALSLNVSPSDLIKYKECSEKEFGKYLCLIERRVNGEPYAYIAGTKEFMKLNFKVNSSVLIPRDDTELLVLEAIKLNCKNILDICTGSGAIAISLAKYIDYANITAIDLSEDALKIAKENARLNNVDVNFIHSDLFQNVFGKFDMIVSNPPYIRTKVIDSLQDEVKREPMMALDGGEDGLFFYKKIIEESKKFLNDGGYLLFEIGFDQALSVSKLLEKFGYINIRVIKDLGGNDRVIISQKGGAL